MYVTLVTTLYTANLTAFLTKNTFVLPINDITDINEKGYNWIAKGGSIFHYLNTQVNANNATNNYVNEHYNKAIIKNYIKTNDNLFIAEETIVEKMIYSNYFDESNFNCDLVRTKLIVLKERLAFVYTKQFKYQPLFDKT